MQGKIYHLSSSRACITLTHQQCLNGTEYRTWQVLLRAKSILYVTRIFRLMRLVKLFQQYLVSRQHDHFCGPMNILGAQALVLMGGRINASMHASQIYRENLKFEAQSGIKTVTKSNRPW